MAIWSAEIKELERLYESFKGQLPDLEKELERLIKADDENMILLYSRRCLEVIITDLCECELKRPRKTEPLKGIIDKLHKEEKVPSHIISSMHSLNEMSTYGAHPKAFDPEQLKPVLVNLDIIIKWYMRYKGLGERITLQTIEEPLYEIKTPTKGIKGTLIHRNKVSIISSGIILVVLIIIAVLYFTNNLRAGGLSRGLEKSIAVLPFINDSPNDSNQYFINGFMEDVLNHLHTIKDLHPISRTSVEKYRKTTKSIPEIAKELSVNYIVEGNMQRYGNSIRLSVNLFKALKKELKLWGKTYEKKINDATDIFSLQSQIAESIASELEAAITPQEKQQIEKTPTSSLPAYEDYILGVNYLGRYTKEDCDTALQYFEKAKEIDPDYELANCGISAVSKRKLAMQHNFNATALINSGDYEAAGSELKVALENDPGYSYAWSNMAVISYRMGDPGKAVIQTVKAIGLDPKNSKAAYNLAYSFDDQNDFKQAVKWYKEAIRIDSTYKADTVYTAASSGLGRLYNRIDQPINAIIVLSRAKELFPYSKNIPFVYKNLGNAYLLLQQTDSALKYLELSNNLLSSEPETNLFLARAYEAAGNVNKSFEVWNKYIELESDSIRLEEAKKHLKEITGKN